MLVSVSFKYIVYLTNFYLKIQKNKEALLGQFTSNSDTQS